MLPKQLSPVKSISVENIVAMKGWSSVMFLSQQHAYKCQDPMLPHSSQNITQGIMLPPLISLLPIVHTGAICSLSKGCTHTCSHDVKYNVIHQTRPPSSIGSWYSSDTHMPIRRGFLPRTVVSMALWPVCSYTSPYATRCNVHSDSCLS